MDLEVCIQENMYRGDRHRGESFNLFVTKRIRQFRELDVALNFACNSCLPTNCTGTTIKRDVPHVVPWSKGYG